MYNKKEKKSSIAKTKNIPFELSPELRVHSKKNHSKSNKIFCNSYKLSNHICTK